MRLIGFVTLFLSVGTVWLNAVTGTGNSRVTFLVEISTLVFYCVVCFCGAGNKTFVYPMGMAVRSFILDTFVFTLLLLHENGKMEANRDLINTQAPLSSSYPYCLKVLL